MIMKRIIILQNEISSYNVDFYNCLTKKYKVSVAYLTFDKSNKDCLFCKIKLESFNLGPFVLVKHLKKIIQDYDVAIYSSSFNLPSFYLLPLYGTSKTKYVTWGIGFRCSYEHPYLTRRKHTIMDYFASIIGNLANANIFYMSKAKEFWYNTSYKLDKVFVAPNTVYVNPIQIFKEKKKDILFVGTLYRGKGIDLLLEAYNMVISKINTDSKLVIVGSGVMTDEIKQYIVTNNLVDKVLLKGAIYDEKLLAEEFEKALICVSPTQGGLSCPKSMGYGVPFICRKDAITGGEIYHINNGKTGIMYKSNEDLPQIILDAITNREKYIDMGIAAKEYYDTYATIGHMAQGAIDAIEYALNH